MLSFTDTGCSGRSSLKEITISSLAKSTAAVERLEKALERLERAVAARDARIPEPRLEPPAEVVARIDGTIARLKTLLQE